MAYYLESIADNFNRVDLDSDVNLSGDGYIFELDFAYKGLAGRTIISGQDFRVSFNSASSLKIEGATTQISPSYANLVIGQRYVFKLKRIGDALQIFNENDIAISNLLPFSFETLNINRFFADQNGLDSPNLDIYRLKLFQSNIAIHDYNPSSSNGTGSILPDDANNNDGTLVNFPIDDSQWVFYTPSILGSHYLAFDGVDDYIRMANFTMPASGIFSYSLDLQAYTSASAGAGVFLQFGSFSRLLMSFYTDIGRVLFDLFKLGGAREFVSIDVDFTEKLVIKFEIDFDLNELRFYINNVLIRTNTTFDFLTTYGGQVSTQHNFGNEFNVRFLQCDLYEINVNNQLLYKNDESNELTYFPEIMQGAHATMFNFTLPDSWVFYPDAGGGLTVDMNIASTTPVVYAPTIVTQQFVDATIASASAVVYTYEVIAEQFVDMERTTGTAEVYPFIIPEANEINLNQTSANTTVLSPEVIAGAIELLPEIAAATPEVYDYAVVYTQQLDMEVTSSNAQVFEHLVFIRDAGTGQTLAGFGILQFIYWED